MSGNPKPHKRRAGRIRLTMHCTVNGQTREIPTGTTIDQLIEQLGLAGSICAAEVDKQIVPRKERSAFVIREGQTIEIVTLVGGG